MTVPYKILIPTRNSTYFKVVMEMSAFKSFIKQVNVSVLIGCLNFRGRLYKPPASLRLVPLNKMAR